MAFPKRMLEIAQFRTVDGDYFIRSAVSKSFIIVTRANRNKYIAKLYQSMI